MAREHSVTATCDAHAAFLDMHEVPATQEKIIPFGTARRVDVCDTCAVLPVWKQLAELLPWLGKIWEFGVDLEERRLRRSAKEIPAEAPKPPVKERQEPKAAKAKTVLVKPKPLSAPEEETPSEPAQANVSKVPVVCPLDHPGTKEGPKEVPYANRSSHSVMVHDLDVWEIPWEDPHGILKEPCLAHQECIDGNYRCTKPNGVTNHINRCTKLKRIDT